MAWMKSYPWMDDFGNTGRTQKPGAIRLHLELDAYNEEFYEVLRNKAGVKYGNSISRDVLVPENMPLYALNHVIQRCFNWQNSHLHEFLLPPAILTRLCEGKASHWQELVGIAFRSPFMDMDFGGLDYDGSMEFSKWQRMMYTGPYYSMIPGELLIQCQEDLEEIDQKEKIYVCVMRDKDTGEEYALFEGDKGRFDSQKQHFLQPIKDSYPENIFEEREVVFADLPVDSVPRYFLATEANACSLRESLPLNHVLALGKETPLSPEASEQEILAADDRYLGRASQICAQMKGNRELYLKTCREMMKVFTGSEFDKILDLCNVFYQHLTPPPFTPSMVFNYDYGDGWSVTVTGSRGCDDLLKAGRIDGEYLDKCIRRVQKDSRPVLLCRDGLMVMDDVGGVPGFTEFLDTIYPDLVGLSKEEVMDAKENRREQLEWAREMGWKEKPGSDFGLL